MNEQAPTRRRRPRSSRLALTFVALVAAGLAGIYGLFWALNPWALKLPGKSALTGYWQGTVSVAPGDDRRVHLDLSGQPCRSRHCLEIKGAAKVCGAKGNTTYVVYGEPRNYQGTRFKLSLRPETTVPGPELGGFEGEWDGDLLTIRTTLIPIGPDGVGRATATADATNPTSRPADSSLRFTMRRSDETDFKIAC